MIVCLILVHLETRQYSFLVVCWPVPCFPLQMHSLIFSRDSSRPHSDFWNCFSGYHPLLWNAGLLPDASASVPFNLLQLCLGSISCTASKKFLWTKLGPLAFTSPVSLRSGITVLAGCCPMSQNSHLKILSNFLVLYGRRINPYPVILCSILLKKFYLLLLEKEGERKQTSNCCSTYFCIHCLILYMCPDSWQNPQLWHIQTTP